MSISYKEMDDLKGLELVLFFGKNMTELSTLVGLNIEDMDNLTILEQKELVLRRIKIEDEVRVFWQKPFFL